MSHSTPIKKLRNIRDEVIDFSDIPEGGEEWFQRARMSYVSALEGLGKEVWDELGGVEKYIQEERDSWDEEEGDLPHS